VKFIGGEFMKAKRFKGFEEKGIKKDSLYYSLRKKVEAQGIDVVETVLKIVKADIENKVHIEWIEIGDGGKS
jgi:hypothetical protein